MNPLPWNSCREELFTYQRDLGVHFDWSILDFSLASMPAISLTSSFSVQDSLAFSVESNHISLL